MYRSSILSTLDLVCNSVECYKQFLVLTGLIGETSGSDGRGVSVQYPSIPPIGRPHHLHNRSPKVQGKAELV